MIFTIDKGVKQTIKSDGSFRVKRVCLDAKIIEIFVAQSPYVTLVKVFTKHPLFLLPICFVTILHFVVLHKSMIFFYLNLQATSQIIDVDSDEIADDVDFVTSHAEVQKIDTKESVPMTMMRNLNDSFNVVAQVEGKKRLRKIKIEKE
jgi:hypothetical protein